MRYLGLLIALVLLAGVMGCGADESEAVGFSKDEIAEYARQQSTEIVSDFYAKSLKTAEVLSVSNHNHWYESDITLHVSCTVFYTLGNEGDPLGKISLQKQYTLSFQTYTEADTIEQSARFVSISPQLQLTVSDLLSN